MKRNEIQQKARRATIFIFFMALLALCSWVFPGCKKMEPANQYKENAVEQANNQYVDSLKRANTELTAENQRLREASKASVAKQEDISKSYKPVYEKINNSHSADQQLQYTKILLAEHARLPLERN